MTRITFIILFTSLLALITRCDDKVDIEYEKRLQMYQEGSNLAVITLNHFFDLFKDCITHSMSQKYLTDDLPRVVNWPARTTVGLSPKFTFNRKFFANMIHTGQFRQMLAYDDELLRKNWIQKMMFCDNAVMDTEILKDFYDREVDQSKTK